MRYRHLTSQFHGSESFERWWEGVGGLTVPMLAQGNGRDSFRGDIAAVDLGAVRLARIRCTSFSATGPSRLVDRSASEMCVLYSVVIGRLGLRQSGREVVLDPSDIALCDLDRPFALSSAETAGPTEWLTVRFPRHMAPLVGGLAPEATANRMCGRRGAGRMLNSVLRAMAEELIEDQATIDVRFANVVLELTGALLAAHGAERMASVDSLLETVQAFIERHLDAAELTPAWIAA